MCLMYLILLKYSAFFSSGVGALLPCVLKTLRGDVITTASGNPLMWSYDAPTISSVSTNVWPIAGTVSVTMLGTRIFGF